MTSTSARLGRWSATGLALRKVVLSVPALALFVVTVTAIPLTVVTVGIGLLLVAVPLVEALADLHRRVAGDVLDEDVVGDYASTDGVRPLARLVVWGRDRQRWRDLLWLLVTSTVGLTLSCIAVGLLLSTVFHLIYPFLYAVTPPDVFGQNLGVVQVDSVGSSFVEWVFAAMSFALWWYGAVPLVRANARLDRSLLGRDRTVELSRRVRDLADSRAHSVDFSAAELRRIERDLHDGAQARLVALGMSLGLADELVDRDPEAVRQLLAEARATSTAALGDLRAVVRGIHPPVLADRGLAGATQALAMDMPLPVMVSVELVGRPPAPVESATYFAIAECLANVGKHADAGRAWVRLGHDGGRLLVEVGDDGRGGADTAHGTGLAGVGRRLSAFDGTMSVSSPPGGPTRVVMEVPCALSSARTRHSSVTD